MSPENKAPAAIVPWALPKVPLAIKGKEAE